MDSRMQGATRIESPSRSAGPSRSEESDRIEGATRIAVVGCGAWGRNHVRTLSEMGHLYAVADEHGQRSFDMAAEFGVVPLAPGQAFEDERVDGVVLALPAELHAPMAEEALRAGKHVLVEKPIALSAGAGALAVAAAEETGRVLMVGHVLRHHPAYRALEELVAAGELGELRYVQSHRLGMGRFHASFDAAWDLAPHDLSLVLALAGEAPVEAAGRGGAIATPGMLDTALIHLRFASGLAGHVMVSRHSPYRERRLTAVGTRGMAVVDDLEDWPRKLALYRHTLRENGRGGLDFDLFEPEHVPVEPAQALTEELRNFVAAIEGREAPRTPGEGGVEVVRVLETALGAAAR